MASMKTTVKYTVVDQRGKPLVVRQKLEDAIDDASQGYLCYIIRSVTIEVDKTTTVTSNTQIHLPPKILGFF